MLRFRLNTLILFLGVSLPAPAQELGSRAFILLSPSRMMEFYNWPGLAPTTVDLGNTGISFADAAGTNDARAVAVEDAGHRVAVLSSPLDLFPSIHTWGAAPGERFFRGIAATSRGVVAAISSSTGTAELVFSEAPYTASDDVLVAGQEDYYDIAGLPQDRLAVLTDANPQTLRVLGLSTQFPPITISLAGFVDPATPARRVAGLTGGEILVLHPGGTRYILFSPPYSSPGTVRNLPAGSRALDTAGLPNGGIVFLGLFTGALKGVIEVGLDGLPITPAKSADKPEADPFHAVYGLDFIGDTSPFLLRMTEVFPASVRVASYPFAQVPTPTPPPTFTPVVTPSPTPVPIESIDFNADGIVDAADLVLLIRQIRHLPTPTP